MVEQDPLLEVFLYEMLWSNTFNEYINFYSVSMMDAATTDVVKVVLEDNPYHFTNSSAIPQRLHVIFRVVFLELT